MKILFINYEFPPLGGGGGTTAKYLAKELSRQGVEIKILTGGFRGLSPRECQDGYEIIRVPTGRKNVSGASQFEMFMFVLLAIRPMFRIIKLWQPDLIHSFFAMPTGVLGWMAKKFAKVPYIVYILGDIMFVLLNGEKYNNNRNILFKKILFKSTEKILNNADLVFTNSIGLSELAIKFFPNREIKVITNGIELANFYPKEKNKRKNHLDLLFVGRFVAQKGLIDLLSALDILVNKYIYTNMKLIIVGDGEEKKIYQDFIKKKKLENYIEFLGWVKEENLNDIYNKADVFVLPSNFEGMSSVVLQAMACGLPVISTKVFGSVDLITNGKNGYLTELGDYQELAEKIKYLADNPGVIEKMSSNSSVYSKNYSWIKIAQNFKEFYQEILKK